MGRIISWWHKEHPRAINIDTEENVPWITANWVEKRPALPEEIEMYNNGICTYKVKE